MAIQFLGIGILSWITFLPVVGMIIILLIPKEARAAMKWTAVGITFLQVVLAVMMYAHFNYNLDGINSQEGMQFVEKAKWIDIKKCVVVRACADRVLSWRRRHKYADDHSHSAYQFHCCYRIVED